MATPVIVPKVGAVMNPNDLASLINPGDAGAGISSVLRRYGYGPTTGAFKNKSNLPIFGIAGCEATGTQTDDAGVATVFPSQFCFPTSKYHNEARVPN